MEYVLSLPPLLIHTDEERIADAESDTSHLLNLIACEQIDEACRRAVSEIAFAIAEEVAVVGSKEKLHAGAKFDLTILDSSGADEVAAAGKISRGTLIVSPEDSRSH